MAVPVIVNAGKLIFWNLSSNVGMKSPNRTDDVQLVQLAYAVAAVDAGWNADAREVFKRVVPGAPYNGADNDPLTLAIRAHQAFAGTSRDCHVSVVNNLQTGMYNSKKHVFLMVPLVAGLSYAMPDYYPRLDKHPKCPPALASTVRSACVFGTG